MHPLRVTLILALAVLALTAKKCPDEKHEPLYPISPTPTPAPPDITVSLVQTSDRITNGSSGAFIVRVTRPAGSNEVITGKAQLWGYVAEKPGQSGDFDKAIADGVLALTGPDTSEASITLRCNSAPPPLGGRAGTLAGNLANTGTGGRVCTPSIPNPCPSGCVGMPSNVCPAGCVPPPPKLCAAGCVAPPPNVCPTGCGSTPFNPCPRGCVGMPSNVCAVGCLPAPPNMCPSGCALPPANVCPAGCGAGVVACVDDPVSVTAEFRGVSSGEVVSVLCMPSVGPTTGSPIP